MTAPVEYRNLTCVWCGDGFDPPHRKGPAPRYCSGSHRQQAYLARKEQRLLDEIQRLRTTLGEAS